MVLIYINDILVTGSDAMAIQQLIDHLHGMFALNNLGHLSYFLGIEVLRNDIGMHLNQHKYIGDLFCMTLSKPLVLWLLGSN